MHLVNQQDFSPVQSTEELLDYFVKGCKPRTEWRIGTEFESIGVCTHDQALGAAPAYDGQSGVGALLETLSENGWEPVREGSTIIALVRGAEQVTFEPGGQLELAARPVVHADELKVDLNRYIRELCDVSRRFGLAWLGVGFRPFGRLADVPWMPKGRYAVMREYMPTRGALAHEMMKRTATVQVNLDYGDEEDAGEKLRACMSITSILTAIFANSPIVDGAESGYQSYRSRVWLDTDPDRCGLLDLAFTGVPVFRAYTEWALDVPLFFVYRDGYQPASGMTFRQFLRDGFRGHRATMEDWALHLSTLFPEARLKRFLEVRGCDSGSPAMVLALAPLCRGLFYDDVARRSAIALTAALDMAERRALIHEVARHGLRARVSKTGHLVGDLARELVAIARDGLGRQAPTELPYLEPVQAIVDSGRTQADALLDIWRSTGGDPRAVIAATSHRCIHAG